MREKTHDMNCFNLAGIWRESSCFGGNLAGMKPNKKGDFNLKNILRTT